MGKKAKFRGTDPHQAAGNEHPRFLVVAGPKPHTSRMRNLTFTALLLLSCCARFDEGKEMRDAKKRTRSIRSRRINVSKPLSLNGKKPMRGLLGSLIGDPKRPRGRSPTRHTGPQSVFAPEFRRLSPVKGPTEPQRGRRSPFTGWPKRLLRPRPFSMGAPLPPT